MRSVPESKMRMALKYPPPTTIIGALSYPLFRIKGWRDEVFEQNNEMYPSFERIKDIFKHVSVRINGKLFTYGTLLRINRMYNNKVDSAITSSPMIIAYADDTISIELGFLIDLDKAKELNITKDEIIRAAWGITRIGSRESIFSVESVEVYDNPEIKQTTNTETRFAFEFKKFKIKGNGEFRKVVDWKKQKLSDYTKAEWVPYFYPYDKVEVSYDEPFNIIKIDNENIILGGAT